MMNPVNIDYTHYVNLQVVQLTQAMLGSVDQNLRAVALTCSPEGILLHFFLSDDAAESREEIEEIVFQLAAFQSKNIKIDYLTIIDNKKCLLQRNHPERWVFLRKDPE